MNEGRVAEGHHQGHTDKPLAIVATDGADVAVVADRAAGDDAAGSGVRAAGPGDLERELLDIAVELIDADIDDIDAVIEATLRRIGESRDVHRAFLFRYDWEQRTAINTHEWCAPGVTPLLDEPRSLSVDRFLDAAEHHRRGETVYVPATQLLPDDDPFRALLEQQGVGATISVPLVDGGECVGFVGYDVYGRELLWAPQDRHLLTVLATLLVNVERRRRHEAALMVVRDLESANEALERFAAVVSHDLRTPLTSIRGFLDLLRSGRVSGELADQLPDRASANVERLTGLIDRLLDDAIAGQAVGAFELVSLDAVLHQVLDQLDGPIAIRNAVIDADDLPTIVGDGAQFLQLLQNLISNSLVHMPEDRQPYVRIIARTTHDTVELIVADNGRGIAASERAKALRSFERLTPAERPGGSGLGLAICQRIVAAHEGTLSLGDAPGGGLAVHVRLPLHHPNG